MEGVRLELTQPYLGAGSLANCCNNQLYEPSNLKYSRVKHFKLEESVRLELTCPFLDTTFPMWRNTDYANSPRFDKYILSNFLLFVNFHFIVRRRAKQFHQGKIVYLSIPKIKFLHNLYLHHNPNLFLGLGF